MDQEFIIDNILNEDTIELDYNKTSYDVNSIIKEDFIDKKEPKKGIGESSNQKENKGKNHIESIKNDISQQTSSKEATKETLPLENFKEKENDKKADKNQKEKIINKKAEEESKKLENFYPPFQNPLDFIQYLEVDRTNGQISNEMKNFILQNNIKKDNKYEVSDIISLSQMTNEISKLDINAINAKCNNIVLCTIDGSLLFYSMKSQILLKKMKPKNLNSYINCIDITDDFTEIICGYQDGTIAVINVIFEEVKYTNNKLYKDCPCMELKIYKKEKGELHFITSGGDGKVYYNILKMTALSSLFWRLNSEQINISSKTPIFMIKFINFSQENQKSYKNLIFLKKYVIFGSLELISVYCVDPIKEVFHVKKPEFIKECVVPDAQIGIGRPPDVVVRFMKKDEKNHLLLIISWGKIIFFYRLPIIGMNSVQNYKELGYYINSSNLLRVGFMNNSVIYCIDKSFTLKLLDSSKINPGKISISNNSDEYNVPKNNSLAEIEKSRLISSNIASQTKVIDLEEHPKNTYLYSVVENNDVILSLIVLGEKQIYDIKLKNWEFFLNNMQKNEDFLNLFSSGIELFKGKMMSLSSLPDKKEKKKVIGEFLKQVVSQYVIQNIGEKKTSVFFLEEEGEKEKIIQCLKMVIEFCIEIEAVEYLFKNIQPIFESKEYGELFLENLEPFILCDKIINIVLPSDIILNLIELYNKNGKLDILCQMLLHINIKSIDCDEIKKRMEELYLITPLIYLYMNGEHEDYFAPLEKMFDYFNLRAIPASKMLINEETNNIDYSKALTKKIITPKEVLNCKEFNGHKILWYIRWCLTGKKFPDSQKKMDKNLFDTLVPKMTYWLLNPKIIEEFLKFDPKNYFMIHKNIFSIEDLRKKLINSANDSKYAIEVKTALSISDIKIDDIKPISLINYMIAWCQKKDDIKIYFYLYDFIISMFSIEKEITIDLKQKSICFILQHYTTIVKNINNQEVKSMNNNLIKLFEKETKFTEEDYKKILSSIKEPIFNEVKLYLFDKIDYFDECLKLYLNKNFNISGKNTKLFKWINDKLKTYEKNEYKYEKLVETIKENVLPIATLSLPKFFELSKEIFQGKYKDIVDNLKEDKNIQLNFIELYIKYIISTYENNENNVTNEEMEEIQYILKIHIYLLCDLNKQDKIIPVIKACPFYPFKECLKYCEKSKAYEPCLFLYLKEGSIKEAFDLANKRLNDTFQKIINNIENDNDDAVHENLFNEFHKYLNDIKKICEYNDLDDFWFDILEQLYKYEISSGEIFKKYEYSAEKIKNANNLHETISKDIRELMEKMCSFVSIKRILEVVSEKSKNAGFKEFKDLLMKILNSYNNTTNILDSARNLLSNLVFENEQNFQILNLKGELLNVKYCLKCKKKFNKSLNNKEKILVFNCKHIFHKDCISKGFAEYGKEIFCPICSLFEFINNSEDKDKNSLIKRNSSIIPEKMNKKEAKFEINLSETAKKTLKKLEKYDNKNLEKHKLMIDNSLYILVDQYRDGYNNN